MELVLEVERTAGRLCGSVRRPPSGTVLSFRGNLELVAHLERLCDVPAPDRPRAAREGTTVTTPSTPKAPTCGELLEIDDRTILVLGQPLDVAHDQPDVGNALVHRAGDYLVLVDTGVTNAFREAVRAAVDQVGPWRRVLLLTTHGHTDHVGNNDLADELGRERGVPVEHFVPARDVDQMRDPARYWIHAFSRLPGVVPLPAPPGLAGYKVVSLFQPLRPFGDTTRTFESLPLERLPLGPVPMTGWSFAGGAVRVLRSQGHCAGHVVVHLPDSGVVHIGDEGNGACGAMRDADQLKLQHVLGAAQAALTSGGITVLTDGHSTTVRRGHDAVAYLDEVLEQATALQRTALDAVSGRPSVRPSEFVAAYVRGLEALGVEGANPNPIFTGMMSLNQLEAIGLRPESGRDDAPWSRPELNDPAPVEGLPHGLALLPAAAAMAGWKLRGLDRDTGA